MLLFAGTMIERKRADCYKTLREFIIVIFFVLTLFYLL